MVEYQELALHLISREIMKKEADLAGLKATRDRILAELAGQEKKKV